MLNGFATPYGAPSFNQGILWVENLQQAEQFELPPGCDVALFCKTKDEVYIRSRDRYNIYSTKIYELKEITPVKPESQYVTRTELEELFQRFLGGARNDIVQPNVRTEFADTKPTTDTGYTDQSSSGGKRKTNGANATGVK